MPFVKLTYEIDIWNTFKLVQYFKWTSSPRNSDNYDSCFCYLTKAFVSLPKIFYRIFVILRITMDLCAYPIISYDSETFRLHILETLAWNIYGLFEAMSCLVQTTFLYNLEFSQCVVRSGSLWDGKFLPFPSRSVPDWQSWQTFSNVEQHDWLIKTF